MDNKILIVEDEKNLQQLYKTELERLGYAVIVVSDGQDALKTLKSEPVDLVLLDLALPDGIGLTHLQHLVDIKRDVKIVINTAYPSYKLDFHSWAADAFLTKSSDLTELKNTINCLLQPETR